jgi:hypothetical protein
MCSLILHYPNLEIPKSGTGRKFTDPIPKIRRASTTRDIWGRECVIMKVVMI